MRLSPFRRPRKYVRLLAVLLIGYAAWLLLVPITVSYKVIEDEVTMRDTHYSWWSNQATIIAVDFEDPDIVDDPASVPIAVFVLLDCGNTFTRGDYEQDETAGPESCERVETPRTFLGIGLAVLGIAGLASSARVPAERLTSKDRAEKRRLLED